MEVIRLESENCEIFDKVCEWNYNWWGKKNNKSIEEVRCFFAHSICTDKLPQTFVAIDDRGEPVGMYQLSMSDDLFSRPDIYPWLINVFVDEKHRGKKYSKVLMETVREKAKDAGIDTLYLYTSHVGLYEKYGWEFFEEVKTFNEESPVERLYKLSVKVGNTDAE